MKTFVLSPARWLMNILKLIRKMCLAQFRNYLTSKGRRSLRIQNDLLFDFVKTQIKSILSWKWRPNFGFVYFFDFLFEIWLRFKHHQLSTANFFKIVIRYFVMQCYRYENLRRKTCFWKRTRPYIHAGNKTLKPLYKISPSVHQR